MPDAPKGHTPNAPLIVHASCVALNGSGLLIRGASGSGKSGLALQLMGMGAALVADDRTCLWRHGGTVRADAPEAIRGQIEARQFGILAVACSGPADLRAIVDMDQVETQRLPVSATEDLLGLSLPVFKKSTMPHFPAALSAYLRGDRLS